MEIIKIRQLASTYIFSGPSDERMAQIFRFVITGTGTVSLDFFTLWFLVEICATHYLLAASIAFVFASSINYLISIKWVFFSGKFNNNYFEYFVFMFFTIVGLSLNYVIMYSGVDIFNLDYLLTKVFSIIIVTIANFIFKKFIVFIR